MKLRVGDGKSRSSRDPTLPPTRADVRSTGGASSVTVTVSAMAADLEPELERLRAPKEQDHILANELLEPVEIGRDAVAAREKAGNEVRAVGTGHGLTKRPVFLVGDDDRDTRKDGLLLVDDTALKGRAAALVALPKKRREEHAERRQQLHAYRRMVPPL